MAEPRPPQRRTRAALRQLLVETGIELLSEDGLGEGGDNLTFQRVFERMEDRDGVRVTHASVIGRIWANQKEFQRDVLAALARGYTGNLAATLERLAPLVATMDLTTVEGRVAGLRELFRVGAEVNLEANTSSPAWRAWMAVWALGPPATAGDAGPVGRALADNYRRVHETNIAIYRQLFAWFGFRPRGTITIDQYVTMVTALAEGCALRVLIGTEPSWGAPRPTGPDGEDQPWTMFGLAVFGLMSAFFEPDPAWTPPTGPFPGTPR